MVLATVAYPYFELEIELDAMRKPLLMKREKLHN